MADKPKVKVKINSEVSKPSKTDKDIKIKHPFLFSKDIIEDCLSTCLE